MTTDPAKNPNKLEIEGSTVVNGDYTGAIGSLSGKVLWGMGFYPPVKATHLAVGGNLSLIKKTDKFAFTGGDVRVGGSAEGHSGKPLTDRFFIGTFDALTSSSHRYLDRYALVYSYNKTNNGRTVKTGLGRSQALKVDTDGDGTLDMDYNGYTANTLIPLSDQLNALPMTGNISFTKAADKKEHLITGGNLYRYVDITREGLLTFTGDGQKHRQVFNLDVNKLNAMKDSLNVDQWSLDFRNIPDGQAIVVNVTGASSYTWNTGWRVYVNGKDQTTYLDATGSSLSNYRAIASRIMWNFPTMEALTLDTAHGVFSQKNTNDTSLRGKQTHGTWLGKAALFPGSILQPRGSMIDYADTNGRILVGKNLTFDIWEHHNAPWVGFDEPQCFNVDGKTSAMLQ